MKNKISLKKLELKINKVNDLKATKVTGGKSHHTHCFCEPIKTATKGFIFS